MLCLAGEDGTSKQIADSGSSTHDLWSSTRAALKELGRKLFWHYRVPSSLQAPAVLDNLFLVLDVMTISMARLHEELICLDDCSEGGTGFSKPPPGEGPEEVPTLLLAAADLQRAALDWKCCLLGKAHASEDVSTGIVQWWQGGRLEAPPAAKLADFLEGVVAAGDRLATECWRLANRRDSEVEGLKSRIEASACSRECHSA